MQIRTINSIELSSVCDNACRYCPAKDQAAHRPTGLMSVEVFEKTIAWAVHFARAGTQQELNLFGVGEPTLNPNVVRFVAYARQRMPFQHEIHLNTNGNTMTEQLAQSLKDAGLSHIDVTGHDHFATAKSIRIFRHIGLKFSVSYDFALQPNNWAGQVDWFEPRYNAGPCPWIGKGQVMVMSDGRIVSCCIDAFATSVLGTVDDDLPTLEVKKHKLCESCHHEV